MKVQKVRSEVKVVIELNEKEANWLHALMQNPFWDVLLDPEDLTDHKMRIDFFNATAI